MSAKTIVAASAVDDALIVVARTAQEISDGTILSPDGNHIVADEDMKELRAALKVWTEKTQEFLKVVSEEGKRG